MKNQTLKRNLILIVLIGFSFTMNVQTITAQEKVDKRVEMVRSDYNKLISDNPNYFGTIKDQTIVEKYPAVLKMAYNVKYEELSCVGLYPEDDLLEAVLKVKLPYGFKGNLCTNGSKEFVAFYIDYNDGSGFVSTGSPAEVNVHDLSYANDSNIFYAVKKPFAPLFYQVCDSVQIVKVRAILSWEKLPTGPGFIPPWGNVVEVWVQIKPKPTYPFFELLQNFKYKFNWMYELDKPLPEQQVIPFPPKPPVDKYVIIGSKEEIKMLVDKSFSMEENRMQDVKMEKTRKEFTAMMTKNPNYFGSIATTKNTNQLMEAVYNLPPETYNYLLPQLSINPEWLSPVDEMLYNTRYEELTCVGLYPEEDLLEAILEVKLPYGFRGDLCTPGSKEYVAFYIDWGSGFQYEATAVVGVHDIPDVSNKHLFYAVKAKIPNIESKLKSCTHENVVKVKAILSWNYDPTPYGHTYSPPWGNVLTQPIQIRPKDGASVKSEIEIINFIHTDDIRQYGTYKGLAVKVKAGGDTDPTKFDRPFGGIIACWGDVNFSGAKYYRFLYSDDNGASWIPITDSRKARGPFIGSTITRYPDNNGWFSISEYNIDLVRYSLTALVHWKSYGKNGNYKIRLELADAAKTFISGLSDEVFVVLDNTAPTLYSFGGTPSPLPAVGVTVKDITNNYRKCTDFKADEAIVVFGNFSDEYFKSFSLKVFGGNIIASGYPLTSGRYDAGLVGINFQGIVGAFNGSLGKKLYSLNLCTIPQTAPKVKCAYGVRLAIWDRSLVGRVSGYAFNTTNHSKQAFVTFDWDPTGCP